MLYEVITDVLPLALAQLCSVLRHEILILFPALLLLAGDCLGGTLAGAGVGVGALAADGQALRNNFV